MTDLTISIITVVVITVVFVPFIIAMIMDDKKSCEPTPKSWDGITKQKKSNGESKLIPTKSTDVKHPKPIRIIKKG